MSRGRISGVVQRLRQAVVPEAVARTDRELLESFVRQRDEAAFAQIVRRHGPLVWGVCRRLLFSHHDAEDAFQATFLVLARKAGSIARRELLANWLYGVAHRAALKTRATQTRHAIREKPVADLTHAADAAPAANEEVLAILDQELARLPDKCRLPILLCDLEGKTHQQAAAQLGWPVGTLSGRLFRARAALGRRLARRGVGLTATALAALLAEQSACAAVPAALLSTTLRNTSAWLAGPAAGVLSTRITTLTEGVLRMMLLQKLRALLPALLLAALLVTSATGVVYRALAGSEPAQGQKGAPAASLIPGQPPAASEKPQANHEKKQPDKGKPKPDKDQPKDQPKVALKDWSREIKKALNAPMNIAFQQLTVQEALDLLRAKTGLNIVVDIPSLDKQERALNYVINLSLKDVTFRTALKHILRQADLSYTIDDGVLVITAGQPAGVRHVYPVADFLKKNSDDQGKALIRVITKTIEPSSWSEMGGKGLIEFFPEGRCLVIQQTPEIHEEIASLLLDLRKAMIDQEGKR